jgi:hypothetical protein
MTATERFIALGTLFDRLPALNDRHVTELLQVLQCMEDEEESHDGHSHVVRSRRHNEGTRVGI